MEGSVINQICASMDSFFDTEKKIGDYIVRNPRELVDAKDDGEISGHISVDDMEGSLRGILSNKSVYTIQIHNYIWRKQT